MSRLPFMSVMASDIFNFYLKRHFLILIPIRIDDVELNSLNTGQFYLSFTIKETKKQTNSVA
jgi:hypothetical protein